MRIGVVPNLDRAGGGIYQYAVTLVAALPHLLDEGDELIVFLYGGETLPDDLAVLPYRTVEMRSVSGLSGAMWYRFASALPAGVRAAVKRALGGRDEGVGGGVAVDSLVDPRWAAWFARYDVDLLIFTADVDLAYRTGVPFAVAIHDIQHRLQPEFPEVSSDGEWERREFRIGNCVHNAAAILVDSEAGREDVLGAYGPDEDVVVVVPFVPASYLNADVAPAKVAHARTKFALPERFAFYPAAFWPHKNHLRIVEALARLRAEGLDVPIVFTGPNGGPQLRSDTFEAAMAAADALGVGDLVHYLGYVDDETMSVLYDQASALVMPTFFGPTNIPVVEAFTFGCPVITSDIRGIREQVAGAAMLVDPRSSDAIADGIRSVFTDADLAESLRVSGHANLAAYSHADYEALVKVALQRALARAGVAR